MNCRSLLILIAISCPCFARTAVAEDNEDMAADSRVELAVAETDSSASKGKFQLLSWAADRPDEWRPGLLGQRYLEGRYQHFEFERNGFIEHFDDTLQGGDITVNFPIRRANEQLGWLRMDGFLSHRYWQLSGEDTGANSGRRYTFSNMEHQTDLGVSFYVHQPWLPSARPFIQVGSRFISQKERYTIEGKYWSKYEATGANLLFATGVEVDITRFAAVRATFDLFKEDLERSTFIGELILWPWNRVYVRMGVQAPFNGVGTGGNIGMGWTF